MSLTYVIPDIHGRCDLLDEALAAIVARGDAGVIVTIGDYVNKGTQSRQVIDRLLLGVPRRLEPGCAEGQPRRHDGGGAAKSGEDGCMDREGR